MEKGAFLDRDGIVNVDRGFVHDQKDFSFCKGIFRLCRLLQDRGHHLFIITNQSGIGRGYYTLEKFHALNEWMLAVFRQQKINISKVYFCPHHPDAAIPEYRKDCSCRKPAPGMILKAAEEFDLDLSESILIGDQERDVRAGINAGMGHSYRVGGEARPDAEPAAAECFSDLACLTAHLETVLE